MKLLMLNDTQREREKSQMAKASLKRTNVASNDVVVPGRRAPPGQKFDPALLIGSATTELGMPRVSCFVEISQTVDC